MFITCPIDLPIFPSFSSHVHLRPGNLMIQRPDVKKLLATASDEPPESRDGISWGHDIIIHIYNYKTKYLYNSYHAQNIESTFDIFWSWIFNGETGILPSKHQHKWPNWISFWPSGSTTKNVSFASTNIVPAASRDLDWKTAFLSCCSSSLPPSELEHVFFNADFLFSAFLHKQGTSAVIAVLFWNQSTKLPWRNVRFQFTFLVSYVRDLSWLGNVF